MSNKKQYHVSKDKDGGWKTTNQGQILTTCETQKQAIDQAKLYAQLSGGEVVTHGRDGKIRNKDSYGNDPFPPKG